MWKLILTLKKQRETKWLILYCLKNLRINIDLESKNRQITSKRSEIH